jgi:hypothetical protein
MPARRILLLLALLAGALFSSQPLDASYRDRWTIDPRQMDPAKVSERELPSSERPRYLYHWTTLELLQKWAAEAKAAGANGPQQLPLNPSQSSFDWVYQKSLAGRGTLFLASDPVGGIGSGKIYPEFVGTDASAGQTRVLLRFEIDWSKVKAPPPDLTTTAPAGPIEKVRSLQVYPQVLPDLQSAQIAHHTYLDHGGDWVWKEWVLFDPAIIERVESSATAPDLRAQLLLDLNRVRAGDLRGIDIHYNGGIFKDPAGLQQIGETLARTLSLTERDIPAFFGGNAPATQPPNACEQGFASVSGFQPPVASPGR